MDQIKAGDKEDCTFCGRRFPLGACYIVSFTVILVVKKFISQYQMRTSFNWAWPVQHEVLCGNLSHNCLPTAIKTNKKLVHSLNWTESHRISWYQKRERYTIVSVLFWPLHLTYPPLPGYLKLSSASAHLSYPHRKNKPVTYGKKTLWNIDVFPKMK